MSVNLNFLVKRGGQLVESSILKPTQNFNLQGVKYVCKSITNIAADGFPIHLHDNLDEIATLRNAGVTLAEIANRFGVNRNVIQKFLNKFAPDAVPEHIRFLKATRIFFLRKNPEEKNKAFEVIDPILQKIAKKLHKSHKDVPYEDFLQDFRLSFLNSANQNAKNQTYNFRDFIYRLKKGETLVVPEEHSHVPLSKIENNGKYVGEMDANISTFEENDFKRNKIRNPLLKERERTIVQLLEFESRTFNDLKDYIGLTTERIKRIAYDKIIPKMKKFDNFLKNE